MVAMQGLVWLALPAVALAAGFEGVITMKEASDGAVQTRNFYFNGEKMRVDEGDSGFSVWDARRKEGLFIPPTGFKKTELRK